LPAIYHLFKDGLIHDDSVILGISRRDITTEQLLGEVELCVNETDNTCDPGALAKVKQGLRMHQMSLVDGAEYDQLRQLLDDIETEHGICMDRLYYLSIPPQMFEPIVRGLGEHGLATSCQHGTAATRLLIEKPFGYDTASATDLIAETEQWFSEAQTYRVDHYIAKNSVVDLLEFRIQYYEVRDIWDKSHVGSVEITAFEQLDIEGRAVFYDAVGAMRDIIQSHLLQIMAIALMDMPKIDTAADTDKISAAIHTARLEVLESVHIIQASEVATDTRRGQYEGYREDVQRPESNTETYAEVNLSFDTGRWQGVPVRLRTGKALAEKRTEIIFNLRGGARLLCHIQPDEGLKFVTESDTPITADEAAGRLRKAVSTFAEGATDRPRYPDAYERVLLEAAAGNHTYFTTSQEIMAAWRIVENIITEWDKGDAGLIRYRKGGTEVEII
jgi:glucose-6-phosphate 1-dehydrogenase